MATLNKKRPFDPEAIATATMSTAPTTLDVSRPQKKPRTVSGNASQNVSVVPAGERKDFVAAFSDELVLHVFQYLSASSLNVCARVSSSWFRIANDRHLWKSLFLFRFPVPRHLSTDRLRLTPPPSRRGSTLSQKDGHHHARHRRSISNGSNASSIVRMLSVVEEDWKNMYKVSHNWQTGNCRLSILSDLVDQPTNTTSIFQGTPPLAPPLSQLHAQNHHTDPTNPSSNPLVQFTRDVILTSVVPTDPATAPYIRIYRRTGASYDLIGTMRSAAVDAALADPSAVAHARIVITCLKLDARDTRDDADRGADHRADRMRRVVAGYSNGGFTIWEFGPEPSLEDSVAPSRYVVHELCTRLPGHHHAPHPDASYYPTLTHHSSASLISLSLFSPYLVTCSADFVLSIHHVSETRARRLSVYTPTGRPSAEVVRAVDVRLAHQLRSYVCWAPVVVEIVGPRDSPSGWDAMEDEEQVWDATVSYAVPVYGAGWSVGMQEIRFTHSHVHSTRHSSPAALEVPIQAPFTPVQPAGAQQMTSQSQSFAPITAIACAGTCLVTAHVDNTVQVYRVVDSGSKQGIEVKHVRTLHGHASRVECLAIDPVAGRMVSGDRAEIKVWDLKVDEEGKEGEEKKKMPMDPKAVEARRREERGEWVVSLGERHGMQGKEQGEREREEERGKGVKWVGFDEGRIVSVGGGAKGEGVGVVKVWSFCDV